MVQVLQPVESFGAQFARGIGQGVSQGFSNAMDTKKKLKELSEENAAIKRETGIDLSGFVTPESRKSAFSEMLKLRQEQEKQASTESLKGESYQTIKDKFGKEFADIWNVAPIGGKTDLLKYAIDAKSRKENINELFQGLEPENELGETSGNLPQVKNNKVSDNFEWPDFSKRPVGYNKKEWVNEKKGWRKENAPVFASNKTRLQANKKDEIGIKNLNRINESKKLPEGLNRIIINPETGDIRGTAQLAGLANTETQEWVKETARFQNRAKDAFGSRVTNFDLMSYMKQFPGLLNTHEGRKRILKMMDINIKLDKIYDQALQKVYQKYGLSEIPQEKADELARKMIERESNELENEYLEIDQENQMEESNELSGRMVDVIGPNGEEGEVDERQIDQLPEGYRIK